MNRNGVHELLLAIAEQRRASPSSMERNTLTICRYQQARWETEIHLYNCLEREEVIWCHMNDQCVSHPALWQLFLLVAPHLNWELSPLLPDWAEGEDFMELRHVLEAFCAVSRPEIPLMMVFDFGPNDPGETEWQIRFLHKQGIPGLRILHLFGESAVRWHRQGTVVPISLKNPGLILSREHIRIYYLARGHAMDEDTLDYLCRVSQRCSHIVFGMERQLAPGQPLTVATILQTVHRITLPDVGPHESAYLS